MRKAGYDPGYARGKQGGWRAVEGLKVERYRALKGRVTWEEYLEAVEDLEKLN
jgi:hypothetical protein